jgi:hypothetical protein
MHIVSPRSKPLPVSEMRQALIVPLSKNIETTDQLEFGFE